MCSKSLSINKLASFIHILPRGYSQRRPRVGCTLNFIDSKNIPYLHKEHGLIYMLSRAVYSLSIEEYCCFLHTYTVLLLYAYIFRRKMYFQCCA